MAPDTVEALLPLLHMICATQRELQAQHPPLSQGATLLPSVLHRLQANLATLRAAETSARVDKAFEATLRKAEGLCKELLRYKELPAWRQHHRATKVASEILRFADQLEALLLEQGIAMASPMAEAEESERWSVLDSRRSFMAAASFVSCKSEPNLRTDDDVPRLAKTQTKAKSARTRHWKSKSSADASDARGRASLVKTRPIKSKSTTDAHGHLGYLRDNTSKIPAEDIGTLLQRAQERDSVVVVETVQTLENLSRSDVHKDEIVLEGGIDVLLHVLKEGPYAAKPSAAGALRNLAHRSMPCKVQIGTAGAIPLLADLARSKDLVAVGRAMAALDELALVHANRVHLMNCDGLPIVLNALRRRDAAAEEAALHAVNVLRQLAWEHSLVIGEAGGIQLLLSWIEQGKDKITIKVMATLKMLLEEDANRARIIASRGIEVLADTLYQDSAIVKDETLRMLRNLYAVEDQGTRREIRHAIGLWRWYVLDTRRLFE